MSKWYVRHSSRQYSCCDSGNTRMISNSFEYALKRSMVRISTGRPPMGRNCFGTSDPMRRPLPPATIIT